MPIYDHNKDLISIPIKCAMQHWERQKERIEEDKVNRLNYKHDGCILGRPDGPDWGQIILEKICLYYC